MLSAAEATLAQGAEDEAERQRIRTKLYAPPGGYRAQKRTRPPGSVVGMDQAHALAAQFAAEDARLTGGNTG